MSNPVPAVARVLVVEDEPSFVAALRSGLSRAGFELDVATDGFDAIEQFQRSQPDIVILDVMLPGLSGLDVCRRIREMSSVPIVMVTARGAEADTVAGLEVGADDYVTKPYRMGELVARIRAHLRRHGRLDAEPVGTSLSGVVRIGDVVLDPDRHEVLVAGDEVAMAKKEFQVLHLLMRNPGAVVRRETLIGEVWGFDYVGDTKTLDVHIKRLREKLGRGQDGAERIRTVRGVGYRFDPTP